MNLESLLVDEFSELAPTEEKPAPVAERSAAGEMVQGFKRGVENTVPSLFGQGMKWFSEPGAPMYEAGEKIKTEADIRSSDPQEQLQPEAHNAVVNSLASGAEMMPASVGPQLLAAAGDVLFPPGAPVFHALAATATGVGFGASQAQDSYEKVLAETGDEEKARKAGWYSGAIEAGGETLASYIGGKYLTGALKVLGPKSGATVVEKVLSAAKNPKAIKTFAKATGANAANEVLTEMGQNSGETAVERAYGVTTGPTPGEAAMAAVSPTLGMSAWMIPFGGIGAYRENRQTKTMLNLLEDKTAPMDQRAQAATFFYQEMAKEDKPAADTWAAETLAAISQDAPIKVVDPGEQVKTGQEQAVPTQGMDPKPAVQPEPVVAEPGVDKPEPSGPLSSAVSKGEGRTPSVQEVEQLNVPTAEVDGEPTKPEPVATKQQRSVAKTLKQSPTAQVIKTSLPELDGYTLVVDGDDYMAIDTTGRRFKLNPTMVERISAAEAGTTLPNNLKENVYGGLPEVRQEAGQAEDVSPVRGKDESLDDDLRIVADLGNRAIHLVGEKPVKDLLNRLDDPKTAIAELQRMISESNGDHRSLGEVGENAAKAHEAATSPLNDVPEPTEAQKEAGNYKKGHVQMHGMDISVENPAGSVRKGVAQDGKKWETPIVHHYGYFKNTVGFDKDQLDVFLGPNAETADTAYVIDQKNKDGSFDEHKAVIGAKDKQDALDIYNSNYEPGWDGAAAITAMPMDEFKRWAKSDAPKKGALAYKEKTNGKTKTNTQGKQTGTEERDGTESTAGKLREEVVSSGQDVQQDSEQKKKKPATIPALNKRAKPLGLKISLNKKDKTYTIKGDGVEKVVADRAAAEGFIAERELKSQFTQENISKSASQAYLDEIKRNGSMVVSFPEHIAESIKKDLGVDIEVDGETIRIKEAPGFEEWLDKVRFYRSGNTKNAELPDGEKVILSKEATKANFKQTSRDFLRGIYNAKTKEKKESTAPDFDEMVREAARWKGATMQVAESQTNSKRAMHLSRMTTKGDLDAYLMRKFDVDETAARDVSNWLTAQNIPADMTADVEDFSDEPWSAFADKKTENGSDRTKPEVKDRGITVSFNKELNGIEISFAEKPSAEVISQLKQHKFRWHTKKKHWYAKQTPERKAFADSLIGGKTGGDVAQSDKMSLLEAQNLLIELRTQYEGQRFGDDRLRTKIDQVERLVKSLESDEAAKAEPVTPEPEISSKNETHNPKPRDKDSYGSTNKLVSQSRADEIRAKLRSKLNNLNSGVDPEMMALGTELAVYHIEAGARSFAKFSKAVIEDLGEKAKPFLKSWYMGAKYFPGMNTEGMDSAADVESADVLAKDKNGDTLNVKEISHEDTGSVGEESAGESGRVSTDTTEVTDEGGETPVLPHERPTSDNSGDHRTGEVGDDGVGGTGDSPSQVREPTPGRGSDRGSTGRPTSRGEGGNVQGDASSERGTLRVDYRITEADQLGKGGPKAKYANNVAAIRTLKKIHSEDRQATPEEQKILVKYVGWGGMPQAFSRPDGTNVKGWDKEVAELQSLMTDEEYASAMRSTPNAHYTAPEIIKGMYHAVQRFGVSGGRVLEPSIGSGNFLGLRPENTNFSFSGVELDTITGGIAKLLYPKQNLHIKGFQDFDIAENSIDLAIGNPPFGSVTLYDSKNKDLKNFSIHNFFFAKSIKALRPGGILSMVVSNSMMDKTGGEQRAWMAERTKLLGAIRLPNNAFKGNAGTEVTTDIIFLQKLHEGEENNGHAWQNLETVVQDGVSYRVNEYFKHNPGMMIGQPAPNKLRPAEIVDGVYDAVSGLVLSDGMNFEQAFDAAIKSLPENVYRQDAEVIAPRETVAEPVEGIGYTPVEGYMVKDGQVFIRNSDVNGEIQLSKGQKHLKSKDTYVDFTTKEIDKITAALRVRDALRDLIHGEVTDATTQRLKVLRKRLNDVYDRFQNKYGYFHSQSNTNLLGNDPDFPLLLSLEDGFSKGITAHKAKQLGISPEKPSAKKAAIFSRRIREPYRPPTRANTAKDALMISLNETGTVNVQRMAQLTGRSVDDIIGELHGSEIFETPTGEIVARDAYLSGNVKRKLQEAKEAARADKKYEANVAELEKVQPAYVEAADIRVRLGSTWIPGRYYVDFLEHLLGEKGNNIKFNPNSGRWVIEIDNYDDIKNFSTWGTGRMGANDLIPRVMQGQGVVVRDRLVDGSKVINEEESALATKKGEEISREFEEWIFKDVDRRNFLEKYYNDNYNTHIEGNRDGSHLTFPGMSADVSMRKHQQDAIWRGIQDGKILMDHVVGAGKTYAAIAIGMEQKRMGLIRKPLYVVPNHLVGQWAEDFHKLYPGSNILALGSKDFTAKRRKTFLARIATGDYDAVIMAHSSFGFIKNDPEHEIKMIRGEIAEYEDFLKELIAEGASKRTRKQVEDAKVKFEERLKKIMDTQQDNLLHFGELGVDSLFVDEAHEFKNLRYFTKLQKVAGLGDQAGSKKASQLFTKVQYLMQTYNGRGVNFLTGTPISNTLGEMFTMQRYMMYDTLKEMGLQHFDSWINNFAAPTPDYELDPIGNSYKMTTRLREFVNIPEVMALYRSFADVITLDYLKKNNVDRGGKPIAWPVPKIKGGEPQNIVVPRSDDQTAYMDYLIARYKKFPKDGKADNPLKATGDGRKMALDMRLIDPNAEDNEGSKINEAVRQIKRIHDANNGRKGTQLVFCDLSVPQKAQSKERKEIETLIESARGGDEKAAEKLASMSPDQLSAATSDFSVYDDIKSKLIRDGIPENEIAFIHDANTDAQKEELFAKVKSGKVRILLGSTFKMGAGMNVQDRLVALHHLDCPWRPSDLEQREGRIIRQGNTFYERDPQGFEIEILRYATKQTVDARMWQVVEAKAGFIGQIRTADVGRVVEDVSPEAASFAEMKAAASGNPLVLEEVQLRKDIKDLRVEKKAYDRGQWTHQDNIRKGETIAALTKDANRNIDEDLHKIERYHKSANDPDWSIIVDGETFKAAQQKVEGDKKQKAKIEKENLAAIKENRKQAGEQLRKKIESFVVAKVQGKAHKFDKNALAEYAGFSLDINFFGDKNSAYGVQLSFDDASGLSRDITYLDKQISEGISSAGLMTRIENSIAGIESSAASIKTGNEMRMKSVLAAAEESKKSLGKGFDREGELKEKESRHNDVLAELKAVESEEGPQEEKDFSRWIDLGGPVPAFMPMSQNDEVEEIAKDLPKFSTSETSSDSVPLTDVEFDAIFKRITAGAVNRDGFVVADTAADLPGAIKAEIEKQGNKPEDIDGVFHRGKVYIVRENITSAKALEEVVFHEWHGHAGLFAMFGNDSRALQKKMNELYGMMKPGAMLRLSRKHGFNLAHYARALREAGYADDLRHATLMEEMLAHLTAEYSTGPIAVKIKEILGMVRDWLRKHGFVKLAQLSESDLAFLLQRSRTYAEAGAWSKGNTVVFNGVDILQRLRDKGITEDQLAGLFGGLNSDSAVKYALNPNDDPAVMDRMKRQLYVPERIHEGTEKIYAEGSREAEAEKVARGSLRAIRQVREISRSGWPEGEYGQLASQVLRPEESKALKAWAEKNGLMLDNDQFNKAWESSGKRGGTEHDVYYNESDGRWYKRQRFTMSDTFTDYFQRLALMNHLNNGLAEYRLEGFVENNGELQPVVSQADVVEARHRKHPSIAEVNRLMKNAGFERVDKAGDAFMGQFRLPGQDYIISDHYKGNVARATDGNVVFIDPLIKPDLETKKDRIEASILAEKYGLDDVRFSLRDKVAATKSFAKKLTPDTKGEPFKVLADYLPERMRAAIGGVLSNPHYGSRKSAWRSKAYDLALERGANANEIKHEIMATDGDYAGLEGLRDLWRGMTKEERSQVDTLLVEGDIKEVEFTVEDLASDKNPTGAPVSDGVREAYFAFRGTVDYASEVMFDRLGRLRLLPYEGSEFYDELVKYLDDGLTGSELEKRLGINIDAVNAYKRVIASKPKIEKILERFRHDNDFEGMVAEVLAGTNKADFLRSLSAGSRELEAAKIKRFDEVMDVIRESGEKIVTADNYRSKKHFQKLRELLVGGKEHEMLVKAEIYFAYLGVREYDSQLAKLKDQWGKVKGYLPRLRKDGEQHVKVFQVDEDGGFTEVWMQPAKTKAGADRLRNRVEENLKDYIPHSFDPDAQYHVVVEPNQATPEEIFLGIGSHRAIEALLSRTFEKALDAGVIADQLSVQRQVLRILSDEISARGFGRHKLHRSEHLIEGYETENTPGILSQFIGGMAGWLSKSEFAMRGNRLMSEIPGDKPQDKIWVKDYVDDALKNSTYIDQWFGTARSFAALMFLGFKASSTMLKATQNYIWGQAVLSKHTKGASRKLLAAQRDVVKDHLLKAAGKKGVLSEEELWVLEEGLRRGRSHANYVRAMSGLDDNGGVLGKGQAGLRWLTEKAMVPFQAVETYWNREPALIAAYRVFKAKGMSKEAALHEAEKFVDDVHFVVGKENIPALLRKLGPFGRTLYTFQSYSHNYLLGLLTSLSKGEFNVVMRSLTALVLFGGLAAVPFGDDLDKWYRRLFGERPLRMLEKWIRETGHEYTDFGDQIADFVMHGAPALGGVNFSRAIAVNVPWLSPEDDSLAERVVGVWGGLAQKVRYSANSMGKGNLYRAAEYMSPEALANILRAYRHYADGATTMSGKPVFGDDGKQVKYTAKDAIIRTFGFMPLEPSKQSQKRWDAVKAKQFWQDQKSDLLARYRTAKDIAERRDVYLEIVKFNKRLRESSAGVLVPGISSRTLRNALRARPNRRELAYNH